MIIKNDSLIERGEGQMGNVGFWRNWTNGRRHNQATHGQGFGFIDTGSDKDMLFYSSDLEGVSYEELQEGQRVSYTEGHGPKGPRAENVKPV